MTALVILRVTTLRPFAFGIIVHEGIKNLHQEDLLDRYVSALSVPCVTTVCLSFHLRNGRIGVYVTETLYFVRMIILLSFPLMFSTVSLLTLGLISFMNE